MVDRKYLNSVELMDLYFVLEYINLYETGNREKWDKVDADLYRRVKLYVNEKSDYFDTGFVNNFIDNNYIVYLLRKIIGLGDSIKINEYLEICGNDFSEINRPIISSEFDYMDSFDLYLYYSMKRKRDNKKVKLRK